MLPVDMRGQLRILYVKFPMRQIYNRCIDIYGMAWSINAQY